MVETVERDQPRLLNRSDDQSSVAPENRAPHSPEEPVTELPDDGLGFECRRVKPFDLPQLARGLQVSHFDQPDSFANRNGVLGVAASSMRPFRRLRPITIVAMSDEGSLQGVIQFRQEMPDHRWILSTLGTTDACSDPQRVPTELLEFSIARAGSRGVKRLFARASQDSSDNDALRSVGFEPYMSETVFRMGNVDSRRLEPGCPVREQEPADTWAVHQLYHASVPRHVQFAEAWTSNRWDTRGGLRSNSTWKSFVLEDGLQLVGWARVRRSGGVASLEFMYMPESRAELVAFVASVMKSTWQGTGVRQVFVTARAYQEELKTALLNTGFITIGSQDLMVRYTTAKLMATANTFVPITASDVRERVPKRVPTYLNGPAREEPT